MVDCRNLLVEDLCDINCDVFDHSSYKYTCTLTGKKVIACIHCNPDRCKNYDPEEE